MSTQLLVPTTADSAPTGYEYDVFLSFCGKDTRKTLTDNLYHRLIERGFRTFKDDVELIDGESIAQLLPKIEQSKISIPIFSKSYASSEWCLRELTTMVQCCRLHKQKIFPIFFDVEPWVVRQQSDSYEEAFSEHEEQFDDHIVEIWRDALTFVGSQRGRVLSKEFDGYEGKLIHTVVSKVWDELADGYKLLVPHDVQGTKLLEQGLMNLLNVEGSDVRFVGIYGKPDSGKTVLAKIIYNKILKGYDRCSFLSNIREKSRTHGLESLQTQLIVDLLKPSGLNPINSVDSGINIISQRLRNKKILVLLDDVSETRQLDALASEHRWFGSGSRIILTTRKREILDYSEAYHSFEVTNPQRRLQESVIGSNFNDMTNEVVRFLRKDKHTSIGLWGIGGVGKTALAENIHAHLVESKSDFHGIYWVSVPYGCTISCLQGEIAKELCVDISGVDDLTKRSAKLSECLKKNRKFILFLDGIWDYTPLNKLGISSELEGCRLILTSRLADILERMGCKKLIKVDTLDEDTSWNLFKEKLGQFTVLKPEIDEVAQQIAKECAGLPLAIRIMGSSMRSVHEIEEWRDTLRRLKALKYGHKDMDDKVYPVLKLSYDRLTEEDVKHCFEYCAVYPESHEILRKDVIELLIDAGHIKHRTRGEEFDRGHTILNQLERACLLEKGKCSSDKKDTHCVKMHNLIRHLVLKIKVSNFVVYAGQSLCDIPDEEDRIEEEGNSLELISLIDNDIEEISIPQECPALTVLLLCRNPSLRSISTCFFTRLPQLIVLNLSQTEIEQLPSSVSDLVTLRALILRECIFLNFVPPLAKLKSLRKLDLHRTAISQVPDGLEMLVNLQYLNLSMTGLSKLPIGILPKLRRLRHLEVDGAAKKETDCLKNLEFLHVCRTAM